MILLSYGYRVQWKFLQTLHLFFYIKVNLLISIMPSDMVSSFMIFLDLVLNWTLPPERY